MRKRAPLTWLLIVTIAIVCVVEALLGAFGRNEEHAIDVLKQMGANVPHMLQDHEYWRLITSMFLHAGPLHWLVNTWALFQLGTLYEVLFGTRRMAIVYFASGIAASAASSLFTNALSVGASGAISGLAGAFIFSILLSPKYRHERWGRDLIGQLAFWIIVNIFIGYSIPHIDNVAHAAGFLTGLLLGLLPHRVPPPPPQQTVIDVRPQPYDG
jgi:rhomboid protease GluP